MSEKTVNPFTAIGHLQSAGVLGNFSEPECEGAVNQVHSLAITLVSEMVTLLEQGNHQLQDILASREFTHEQISMARSVLQQYRSERVDTESKEPVQNQNVGNRNMTEAIVHAAVLGYTRSGHNPDSVAQKTAELVTELNMRDIH